MSLPVIRVLSDEDLRVIHEAAMRVLVETGLRVHHDGVLERLREQGGRVEFGERRVRFPEDLVMRCVAQAGKSYVLHGRDPERQARFGCGEVNLMSSPGQAAWVDADAVALRSPTVEDCRAGILLADALPQVTVVGGLAQPGEWPAGWGDVRMAAELVRGSTKPTRGWVHDGRAARHVLEVYRLVAGGSEALRRRPMTEAFLEPVSPLQLPREGLEAVLEFVGAGQPVSVNPLGMTSGTAPATLAGTLVQEHAEILAGVVVVQVLGPGTPVLYGGIPHIMDPRTSACSFGSPEQGLLAAGMAQLGRSLGFPVYVNVGLTDAKTLDAQAGAEKGASLVLGLLAGADLVGHAGICGADQGASLEWLVFDDELMGFARRTVRGFEVSAETLAEEVIHSVGPGGSYLAESHTVRHYRRELWIPGAAWSRHRWRAWTGLGQPGVAARARERARELLAKLAVPPLDPALAAEIEKAVACAEQDFQRTQ